MSSTQRHAEQSPRLADGTWASGTSCPALLTGLACGAALFAWLVVANRGLLSAAIIEDSDFAANSILVDKAEQFRLLVGNYSRVGFNHPGPALLYAQAFGDVFFHRLLRVVPGSFNGQYLGIVALTSTCVGLACGMIRRLTGRWIASVALLALLPIIDVWQSYALATSWMPGAYIAPFLVMVVAAASVALANWRHLWVLVTGAGLCMHGHVAFVLFAGVTVVAAIAAGWLRGRRSRAVPTRSNLLWAGIVLAAFLSPIVANLVLHWPGEIGKYLSFSSSQTGFAPRTAGDVLGFAASFWIRGGAWFVGVLLAAVALVVTGRLANRDVTARSANGADVTIRPAGSAEAVEIAARFRLDLVAMCVLQAALFVVYAARGVDDLTLDYVGWFMLACPLLVLWAGWDAAVELVGHRFGAPGRATALAATAVVAIVLVSIGDTANPYRGMNPALAAALPSGPVRLAFGRPGWQAGLGLIEDARRRGQPVCVPDPMWSFMVTPSLICTDSAGPLITVLGAGEPRNGTVIFDDGTNAMVTR